MLNESVFFLQVVLIIAFSLLALKRGSAALTTWITVQALLANLFVLKQITLFGLNVTASDGFAIGSLLGINLLQEYFSKEEAKKASWIAFGCMLFFAVSTQLHLLYTPSSFDNSQEAFALILSPAPRLLIASLTVFFIVQRLDMRLFAFLKSKWPTASFAMRASFTLIVSECIDTVLFSFAGLYGIVASVGDIIMMSLMIKVLVILGFSSATKWMQAKT